MKTPPLAVAGLICLALAGCRTDPTVTLLERQNRLLEDEVYRLRGVIQDNEEGMTQNCTVAEGAEGASAHGEIRKTRQPSAEPSESYAPRSRNRSISGPTVEMPNEPLPPNEIPDTLKHPVGTRAPVESGKQNAPETPKQWQEPSGPNLPGQQGTEKGGLNKTSGIHPAGGFESPAKADSKYVGQLVLNRMLTGGFSTAGRSGDDGVLAVLEPRDVNGRRLEAPADVAVVLVDPSKTGKEAKLARWDFPAAETAKLFRGSGIARGMYVECPWPDRPPENNRLHLFVRYTTRDGRKLEADQSVEVALPGEKAARWTPAEPEPHPAAAQDRGPTSYRRSDMEGAESDASDSSSDDSQPSPSPRSHRTASRANSPALQRPVWSPERF
ncbi:MAG: hypothetical protein ABSA26_06140 [Thermoguttaceae bacterium]|jgi:hypothetical protein